MTKTELTKLLHKEYHLRFKDLFAKNQFKRHKSNDYMRITGDNLLQRINIQKDSWDTGFTFNIMVFPLYLKADDLYYAFGGIHGCEFKQGRRTANDNMWRYSDESEMENSLTEVFNIIQTKIMPLLDQIYDTENLINYLNLTENLFISYKYHPGHSDKEMGILLLKTGNEDLANELLDSEMKNEIKKFESVNAYFEYVLQENYSQFKIDGKKYKYQ
jgi:hypothetical protein